MAAILGIYASQISGHLYPGPAGAYDALASVTVGSGGASSIEFTGIPSTYRHLQLRAISNASSTGQALMSFNGDTSTSSYSFHQIIGADIGSPGADGYATGTLGGITPSLRFGGTSYFGTSVIDVLDYASTVKNKVTRTLLGYELFGSGQVQLVSGCWYNASDSINKITFTIQGGGTFVQNTQVALYGVK